MSDYYEQIADHAHGAPQEEVCGLLLSDNEGGLEVVRCPNAADDTRSRFVIADSAYLAAWRTNRLVAYYHSHWNSSSQFSDEDKIRADVAQLPVFCYSVPERTFNLYRPSSCIPPLEERPFILGFQDCASLVTDFYQKNFNVEVLIPYFARPHKMIEEGFQNLGNFLEMSGFSYVRDAYLKDGDILAFAIRSPNGVPNHVAIYLGDGMMVHQLAKLPSTYSPVDTWRSRYCFAMRYMKGAE